jgi:hypothetical protein
MKGFATRAFGSAAARLVCLLALALVLTSCNSARQLTRGMCASRTSLYYTSTTKPYDGVRMPVVLKDVSASNMDVHSVVKHRSTLVVPLLLYNYTRVGYDVRFGEQSLDTGYRPFFIDALRAESDYSGNYRLLDQAPDIPLDSLYILEIKFDSITTGGRMNFNDHCMLLTLQDDLWYSGVLENRYYKLRDLKSQITAHAILCRGTRCVLRRDYNIVIPAEKAKCYDDNSNLCNEVTHAMARQLGAATCELVSTIVQDVSLAIAAQGDMPSYSLAPGE